MDNGQCCWLVISRVQLGPFPHPQVTNSLSPGPITPGRSLIRRRRLTDTPSTCSCSGASATATATASGIEEQKSTNGAARRAGAASGGHLNT
jgi:hypothetical protein